MAKKKSENGTTRKAALAMFFPDDVMAGIEAARSKAEASLGVSLSRQQTVIGLVKKALAMTK